MDTKKTARVTVDDIKEKKKAGQKITMLTAYDYPLAHLIDQCELDIILVGDSVANVVLGLDSTREVGMEQMIHHARAVRRAVTRALMVGDMPYEAYQVDQSIAVDNARRFIAEAGCGAVKLEWFEQCIAVTKAIHQAGIPVMGHVGLTPQTADKLGGFKVQGKDADSAVAIITQAQQLEDAGCFSIVLECIPTPLAEFITQQLTIPTIGIGAGMHCDGQVLVTHDLLGLFDRFRPKFVKRYIDSNTLMTAAIIQYKQEVLNGVFPTAQHSYTMDPQEFERLRARFVAGTAPNRASNTPKATGD